jgi:hypothetical protein
MRITEDDYQPLKAFFAWAVEHLLKMPATMSSADHPVAALERTEAESKARARQGLAMAVGDIVEDCDRLSADQVQTIDAALEAAGILTLSQVRARFWTRVRRVLKRGTIRSELDYYAVRNVVEALPEGEQGPAWEMLAAFEEKAIKGAL